MYVMRLSGTVMEIWHCYGDMMPQR